MPRHSEPDALGQNSLARPSMAGVEVLLAASA
jgi:hypothetical protein